MLINNPLPYQWQLIAVQDTALSGTDLTPFNTGNARQGCYFCFDQDVTWAYNTSTTGSNFKFSKGVIYVLGGIESIKNIKVTTTTSTNFYLVEVERV